MPTILSGFSIHKSVTVLLLFCLVGCYKNHLYIQEEKIDINYLASVQVDTPDPRQENPPTGKKLLIAWDFPKSLFDEGLSLQVTVRLWSNKEQQIAIPVERKRDTTSLFFPASDPILTYLVQVRAKDGRVVETWEHQFWTPLIDPTW